MAKIYLRFPLFSLTLEARRPLILGQVWLSLPYPESTLLGVNSGVTEPPPHKLPFSQWEEGSNGQDQAGVTGGRGRKAALELGSTRVCVREREKPVNSSSPL